MHTSGQIQALAALPLETRETEGVSFQKSFDAAEERIISATYGNSQSSSQYTRLYSDPIAGLNQRQYVISYSNRTIISYIRVTHRLPATDISLQR
jgi:hypothetical protein